MKAELLDFTWYKAKSEGKLRAINGMHMGTCFVSHLGHPYKLVGMCDVRRGIPPKVCDLVTGDELEVPMGYDSIFGEIWFEIDHANVHLYVQRFQPLPD